MKLSYMELMYINGSLEERKAEIIDEIDCYPDKCIDDETWEQIDGLKEEHRTVQCIVDKMTAILSQG